MPDRYKRVKRRGVNYRWLLAVLVVSAFGLGGRLLQFALDPAKAGCVGAILGITSGAAPTLFLAIREWNDGRGL
jgi:hypothetical protein